MAELGRYNIDLKALQTEQAHYEYRLDDSFFASLEGAEVQKGSVLVSVDVKKLADSFELDFHLDGSVTVICDRCLDEMSQAVTSDDTLYVKFGQEFVDAGDDVIIVPEEDGFVNVAWFIYEFIALAIPMRHVHPKGECNPVMEAKLSRHTSSDEETNTEIDPRWAGLKNLLDNN